MASVSHRKEGEVVMYKRILKTLLVAVVVGIAIPVSAAVAMPVTDSAGPVTSQSSSTVASEVSTGLAPVAYSSKTFASEISTGVVAPSSGTSSVVASTDNGFNWSYAGIGAGVLFASLLVATGGVLTLRRHHHRPLAH
jgi:hypothetical protein